MSWMVIAVVSVGVAVVVWPGPRAPAAAVTLLLPGRSPGREPPGDLDDAGRRGPSSRRGAGSWLPWRRGRSEPRGSRGWGSGGWGSGPGRHAKAQRYEVEAYLHRLLHELVQALEAGLSPSAAVALCTAPRSGGSVTPGSRAGSGRRRGRPLRTPSAGPGSGLVAAFALRLHGAAAEARPLAGEFGWLVERSRSPSVLLVSEVWSLSEAHGMPLAEGLALAASMIDQERESGRRLAAALAGPRATATVLTLLPLCAPLAGMAVGVSPLQMYTNVIGGASAAAGMLCVVVGRRWTRHLVERVTRPEFAR